MGPRWRLIRSRELLSKETFQQHEVKMSYNLPLDFQWNMEVQIPFHLHKKKNRSNILSFFWHSCSVSQLCPTLRDAMDCSMPGFPVLHHLPEFAHSHVHWVDDAIQSSHPLSPPSLSALNLSQHQGLFQRISSLLQVAKVLELQHQSLEKMGEVIYIIYLTELREIK